MLRPLLSSLLDSALGRMTGGGLPWEPAGGPGLIPPTNIVAPTTTGTYTLGSTLSGTDGEWVGNPPPVLTYSWKRDGVEIATTPTYVLTALDMHRKTRRDVIGTNALGSTTATANELSAVRILDLSIGTFTRSTEASYPTSANHATIGWAGVNVLRNLATLGDETPGALLAATYLFEQAATNYVLRSEELDNAVWLKTNTTIAANDTTAPDGAADMDAVIGTTAGLFASVSQSGLGTGASTWVASCWVQKRGTNTTGSIVVTDGVTPTTLNVTLTDAPQRVQVRAALAGLGTIHACPHPDGLSGTLANAGDDMRAWGFQFEWVLGGSASVPAASSYVRTTSATVTRATDLLTFTNAQIPEAMRTGRFQQAARADWIASENTTSRVLGRVEATAFNVWRFESTERIGAYEAGALRVQSNVGVPPMSTRYERRVYVLDLPAGRFYVDGVAQTVGTIFDWTAEAGTWAIGTGAVAVFAGRLSDVYAC